MPPRPHTADHDLLIQIDTKLTLLADTVSTFVPRFEALDARKVDVSDHQELKAQVKENAAKIDGLQKFRWMLVGGLTIIELALHLFFKF